MLFFSHVLAEITVYKLFEILGKIINCFIKRHFSTLFQLPRLMASSACSVEDSVGPRLTSSDTHEHTPVKNRTNVTSVTSGSLSNPT